LKAAQKSEEILQSMATPVDLTDKQSLINSCNTSLNSKVVSQYASILSPIAVESVLHVIDPKSATNVDLRDVKVIKKLGGTIEDTEAVNGLVFTQKVSHNAGGPTRVENAKIGLIQFFVYLHLKQIWKEILQLVIIHRWIEFYVKKEITY